MSTDEPTIAVYDAQADAYAKRNETLYEVREAKALIEGLPDGAKVLDLGCGPGQYAAWFADHGCDVDAWDASAEMVARASKHPKVNARQAQFVELDAEHTYDAIWANFSLLHARRTELPDLLARVHRALKQAGKFHVAMKLGAGEGPDKIGRFYTYYSEEELEAHLTEAGFSILARRISQGEGLDGSTGRFITLLCHG
ncbi:class I SAM-dependent DNA methyltransferase [Celeribacter litoreus]|uniref:class I SAM-dependent DNA methyltransferase n=1 Tax=Celeribacter litoreus TaxID=2876714 RepID=UPI001CD0364B|nr:class I SAM-dependent methyltransferase [Celeribacter litoreus]MCA0042356.1 methyltransferase domain-containing protein [Celeribacter litoreus]